MQKILQVLRRLLYFFGLLDSDEETLLNFTEAMEMLYFQGEPMRPLKQLKKEEEGMVIALNSIAEVLYVRRGRDPLWETIYFTAKQAPYPLKATFRDGRLIHWRNNEREECPITVSVNFSAVQLLMALRRLFIVQEEQSLHKDAATR